VCLDTLWRLDPLARYIYPGDLQRGYTIDINTAGQLRCVCCNIKYTYRRVSITMGIPPDDDCVIVACSILMNYANCIPFFFFFFTRPFFRDSLDIIRWIRVSPIPCSYIISSPSFRLYWPIGPFYFFFFLFFFFDWIPFQSIYTISPQVDFFTGLYGYYSLHRSRPLFRFNGARHTPRRWGEKNRL
jgi:hypothetical protein